MAYEQFALKLFHLCRSLGLHSRGYLLGSAYCSADPVQGEVILLTKQFELFSWGIGHSLIWYDKD